MSPGQISEKVVQDRISWIRRMVASINELPLTSVEEFAEQAHVPAAAESYLRRGLEALLDLGRHMLAKGFGRAASEYKAVASELEDVGVLTSQEAQRLREMAGYRNRMVHFYHEISVEELYEICTTHLSDVERLADSIERWIRDHPDKVDASL